jgi:hypothetical protein
VDARDNRALLDMRAEDVRGLSAGQARAVSAIAGSPFPVQPLAAPAGAGKTHSLSALVRRGASGAQTSAGARADRQGRR